MEDRTTGTARNLMIRRRQRRDREQSRINELRDTRARERRFRSETMVTEQPTRNPFSGFPRGNVIARVSPPIKQSVAFKQDRASRVLSRNIRNNIMGIYEGVGLIPRIKITPSNEDIQRGYLISGDFAGSSLERVFDIDDEGAGLRWVAVVPNHPRYSQRTITKMGNNLRQLYAKLDKEREDWINFVLSQSEVYDITQNPVGVRTATSVEARRTLGDIFTTPMFESCVMELDGYAENNKWCSNTRRCVPDYIMHLYGKIKGYIKKCNYETIEKIAGTVPWGEPNKNGYAIGHIIKIAENFGVNMYAIEHERLIYRHEPTKRTGRPAMVFCIRNNHLYPILDKKGVKKWTEKAKQITSNIHGTKKKNGNESDTDSEEEIEEEEKIPFSRLKNEWGSDSLPHRVMQHAHELNKQPSADVIMSGNNIVSYKNEGVNYDFTTRNINGMSLPQYIKSTELWKEIPQSYVSPEVRAALGSPNVKHRTHYGGIRYVIDRLRRNNPSSNDRVETYDINKHYRSIMTNPLDDWMLIEFNSTIEERDNFDGSFGMWFVKTDDTSILHGNNWYTNTILQYAKKRGVDFHCEYFIIGVRKGKTCLAELIKQIDDEVKDPTLNKLVVNLLSGLIGKTASTTTRLQITKDKKRTLQKLSKMLNPVMYQYKDMYMSGDRIKKRNISNTLPIYIQILDFANITLAEHIRQAGGTLVFRKTDAFTLLNPTNVKTSDEVGGYKREVRKFNWDTVHLESAREKRNVIYKKPKYKFNNLNHIRDSDDWKKVFHVLKTSRGCHIGGRAGTGKTWAAKQIVRALINYIEILNDAQERPKADGIRLAGLANLPFFDPDVGDPVDYLDGVEEDLPNSKKNKIAVMGFTNKSMLNWVEYDGKTIHKMVGIDVGTGKYDPKKIQSIMNKYKYIVLDEISMIPLDLWKVIYELKLATDKTFITIGDYRQLPATDDHNFDIFTSPLLGFLTGYTSVEFKVRKRFDKELWDFSEQFAGGQKSKLKIQNDASLDSAGTNICYFNKTRKAVNAYKNKDVSGVLVCVKDCKKPSPLAQDAILAVGVPVIANISHSPIGLVKNESLKIIEIQHDTITLERDRNGDLDIITDLTENFHEHFLLGYCMTVHKSQGETIQGQVNIFDWYFIKKHDRIAYTAVTRATNFKNIHVSSEFLLSIEY